MKRLWLMSVLLVLCTSCAAANKTQMENITFFAMDTVMEIQGEGENCQAALEKAEQEIYRLESLLTLQKEDSDAVKLQESAGKEWITVDASTAALLEQGQALWEETDGAFDLTMAPVTKAWGFGTDHPAVPNQSAITDALSFVDGGAISVQGTQAMLEKEGMAVDFGGIAKGYAADRAAEVLQENGITAGILSLGGNVRVFGEKADGSLWHIGVQDPQDESALLGIVTLSDGSVVTSGGYQRNFTENGKTYHSIMDPKTGCPAESGLLSVTIVCQDGTRADGLSAALFVMGEEKAIDFWKQHTDFEMILATEDGRLLVSEGLNFSDASGQYEMVILQRN